MSSETKSDFFANHGTKSRHPIWRRYWKLARVVDAAADLRIALPLLALRHAARKIPPQRVLIAAVEVPGREADLRDVVTNMSRTMRHHVTVATQKMQPRGKFDNIAAAIADRDLADFDWLLITDDDVKLPRDFLDLLIYFAHTYDLKLAQPAHRFRSYSSAQLIVRRWATLVRHTLFVENGPITLIHKDAFPHVLPFPSLRWAWGIDVYWSHIARQQGWRLGVIDGLPTMHWRPVGNSYDQQAARKEAEDFLHEKGVTLSRREITSVNHRLA